MIKISIYTTNSGKAPFNEWLEDLDTVSRAIVRTRLDRIRLGNFGDSKVLKDGDGVRELRIEYGPGYRVYFVMHGTTLIVLLIGGDKGSQSRDMQRQNDIGLNTKGY